MTFRIKLLNKNFNMHSVFNENTRELKFMKNGECIEKLDLSKFTDEQIEDYLSGVIEGLKEFDV